MGALYRSWVGWGGGGEVCAAGSPPRPVLEWVRRERRRREVRVAYLRVLSGLFASRCPPIVGFWFWQGCKSPSIPLFQRGKWLCFGFVPSERGKWLVLGVVATTAANSPRPLLWQAQDRLFSKGEVAVFFGFVTTTAANPPQSPFSKRGKWYAIGSLRFSNAISNGWNYEFQQTGEGFRCRVD